jgi:hypothetical protein
MLTINIRLNGGSFTKIIKVFQGSADKIIGEVTRVNGGIQSNSLLVVKNHQPARRPRAVLLGIILWSMW